MLTNRDLFQASTVSERTPDGIFDASLVESWRSDFNISDRRFSQYLEHLGMNLDSFGRRLSSLNSESETNKWVDDLRLMLASRRTITYPDETVAYGAEAFPGGLFPTFFAPFISYALEKLAPIIDSNFNHRDALFKNVYSSLFTELLRDALPTLVEAFHESGKTREEFESSFQYIDGHEDLFREYPVLARTLVQGVNYFVENITMLLSYLLKDEQHLQSNGFISSSASDLVRISPGLGDPHQGHKTVCSLEFLNETIYYRPREAPEFTLYNKLLKLLGLDSSLPLVKHLSRESRCWVSNYAVAQSSELLGPEHCFKMGLLGAVLYILGTKDMHMENVVATAEGPVPVDLETIMAPETCGRSNEAFDLAKNVLNDSPLGTGIFPVSSSAAGRQSIEVSALFGGLKPLTGEYDSVQDPFGENIQFVSRLGTIGRSQNLPLGVTEEFITQNWRSSLDGFNDGMERIKREYPHVLATLNGAGNIRCRVLVRPTSTYDIALRTLRHPNFMRSMLAKERFLMRFWRKSDLSEQLPGPMIGSETFQLLQGDIPYFSTVAGSNTMPGVETGELILRSPLDRSTRLLKSLQDPVTTADAKLYVEEVLSCASDLPRELPQQVPNPSNRHNLDQSTLTAFADAYFQQFLQMAVLGDDDAGWIGFASAQDSESIRIAPLGTSIYDGNAGIAIALASYYHVSKDDAVRALALRALKPVIKQTKNFPNFNGFPIGGFSGMSAALYAINVCRILLDEPHLSSELDPNFWAPVIQQNIRHDKYFDVTTGAAGALSVVCSLIESGTWELNSEEGSIVQLQSHLLENSKKPDNGVGRAWSSGDTGIMLGGFSHGSAGVALTLARSLVHVPSGAVAELVQDSIDFEANYYSESAGLWKDMRPENSQSDLFPNHWCHGAAGILMAHRKIGLLHNSAFNIPSIPEFTWEQIVNGQPPSNHSLCHGQFGNALCFEPIDKAVYTRMISSSVKDLFSSEFVPGLELNVSLVPGLMLGHAGALYTFSKLLKPQIPNVLWLE